MNTGATVVSCAAPVSSPPQSGTRNAFHLLLMNAQLHPNLTSTRCGAFLRQVVAKQNSNSLKENLASKLQSGRKRRPALSTSALNPSAALAGVADDPLCLGFAGDKTYTIIIVACILQAIALIGAAVGGNLARQRKLEVEKINGQLRQIFAKMRRQYQVETYAPSLTYAPAPAFTGARVQDAPTPPPVVDPAKQELIQHLKAGKRLLREKKPEAAFEEFQMSLALARQLNNRVEEKKAARGLGASCQRQRKYNEAIKYHSMVLTVSHLTGEHSGYTEALGAIADCYTELGDLENAAKFYDQYIARLDNDE